MHSNVAGPRFINREPPPASHDSRSVLVLPGHPVPQLVQGIKGAVRQAAHATRSSPEGFSHATRVSLVGRTSSGGPKVWPPPQIVSTAPPAPTHLLRIPTHAGHLFRDDV